MGFKYTASILSVLCLIFFLLGCGKSQGSSGPCAGIDCSGHGVCVEGHIDIRCDCDDGYIPDGLECVEDDTCHYDCFDYMECVNGEVIYHRGYPVPCDEWSGSCQYPSEVVYRCEKGCRRDLGMCGDRYFYSECCEENRPKVDGDPCVDSSDCQPPESPDVILECDTEAGVCVRGPLGDGLVGDPCPYGIGVHEQHDYCAAAYTCVGDYNIGTCTDVADCTFPVAYNPVCLDGKCAYSFCAASCDEEDCAVGYVRRQISGKCYCYPES